MNPKVIAHGAVSPGRKLSAASMAVAMADGRADGSTALHVRLFHARLAAPMAEVNWIDFAANRPPSIPVLCPTLTTIASHS